MRDPIEHLSLVQRCRETRDVGVTRTIPVAIAGSCIWLDANRSHDVRQALETFLFQRYCFLASNARFWFTVYGLR
jgi:hypothetical protein